MRKFIVEMRDIGTDFLVLRFEVLNDGKGPKEKENEEERQVFPSFLVALKYAEFLARTWETSDGSWRCELRFRDQSGKIR